MHFSVRALAAAAVALAAVGAHAETFKLNMVLETDADTVLRDIQVDAKRTVVNLLVRNTSGENLEACLHATGSADAFTLTDLDSNTVLPQVSSAGLSDCAKKMDVIANGRTRNVRLTFGPLPAGAKRLQLGEASCQPRPESDLQYWCFKDIVLNKR